MIYQSTYVAFYHGHSSGTLIWFGWADVFCPNSLSTSFLYHLQIVYQQILGLHTWPKNNFKWLLPVSGDNLKKSIIIFKILHYFDTLWLYSQECRFKKIWCLLLLYINYNGITCKNKAEVHWALLVAGAPHHGSWRVLTNATLLSKLWSQGPHARKSHMTINSVFRTWCTERNWTVQCKKFCLKKFLNHTVYFEALDHQIFLQIY